MPLNRLAIKYGSIAVILIVWTLFVYLRSASIQRAYDANIAYDLVVKHQAELLEQQMIASKKTDESAQTALKLQTLSDEKAREIDQLHNDLHAVKRVSARVCESLPEDIHPGEIKNPAAITATISKEFKGFLESLTRRADDTGAWGEVAYEWLDAIDKNHDGVLCDD